MWLHRNPGQNTVSSADWPTPDTPKNRHRPVSSLSVSGQEYLDHLWREKKKGGWTNYKLWSTYSPIYCIQSLKIASLPQLPLRHLQDCKILAIISLLQPTLDLINLSTTSSLMHIAQWQNLINHGLRHRPSIPPLCISVLRPTGAVIITAEGCIQINKVSAATAQLDFLLCWDPQTFIWHALSPSLQHHVLPCVNRLSQRLKWWS